MSDQPEWVFVGNCVDGERFELEGINVWSRGWQATGEETRTNDPMYTWQHYDFPVYTMTDGVKTVEFAAGEFSNMIWGFFQRKQK